MSRVTLPRPDVRQLFVSARFSPLMAIAIAALALLTLLAAAFATYALLAPEADAPARAATDWKAPLPSVVDLGEPRSASADTQILTRPIFNKDRRPTPKATQTSAARPSGPLADAPTGIKVSAIVKRRQDSRAFVTGANGQGEWKKAGEKVDEWTISEIAPQELTLSNGVNTARLQLYSDKPAPDDPSSALPKQESERDAMPPGAKPQVGGNAQPPQPDPDAPPPDDPPPEPPAAP